MKMFNWLKQKEQKTISLLSLTAKNETKKSWFFLRLCLIFMCQPNAFSSFQSFCKKKNPCRP